LKPIEPEEIFKVAAEGQRCLRYSARLNVIYYLTGAEREDEKQMLMSLASRNGGQFPLNSRRSAVLSFDS
jgi:hypothetical protein